MRKIKYFLPPIIVDFLRFLKKKIKSKVRFIEKPMKQELDLYYDPEMAKILDSWGERNAWIEIQHLLFGKKAKILDIACGTGKVIEILKNNKNYEIYGCDISDFLIEKAIKRGIDKKKLLVCDATNLPYDQNEFDYSYSIGSLEHFTEDGIKKFLISSLNVTKYSGFHMIPISRDGKDHGWIQNYQSYFNNSVDWWSKICTDCSLNFSFLDSSWEDEMSVGKWLIITKES